VVFNTVFRRTKTFKGGGELLATLSSVAPLFKQEQLRTTQPSATEIPVVGFPIKMQLMI
jgi:hypothetical protein